MVLFGPAGNSESFTAMGYKFSKQVPEYLEKMGLDAFEYQCGRGVRLSEATAREIGSAMAEQNITVSLHAPYYISLSGAEENKRLASLDYILQSAQAVDWLGGNRIIVHSGSVGKMERADATKLAKETLLLAQKMLDDKGFRHIHICPETMGKVGQLGTLEEVLELCQVDERMIPCIDFGHLYARSFGGLQTKEDYCKIFDLLADKLGEPRSKNFHVHFSRIEYTNPGGEKRHLTFADQEYGPPFEPFMELLYERKCSPVIICESAGTQAEDAKTMKTYYHQLDDRKQGAV